MMFLKSLTADGQPWGELGFRRIRVKNYYVYFCVDENKREVQILAVIYAIRNWNNCNVTHCQESPKPFNDSPSYR